MMRTLARSIAGIVYRQKFDADKNQRATYGKLSQIKD